MARQEKQLPGFTLDVFVRGGKFPRKQSLRFVNKKSNSGTAHAGEIIGQPIKAITLINSLKGLRERLVIHGVCKVFRP